MPRTWARQWMHFSEGTPFFKPSLMSQFTVGTNILVISLHPSSTVFLTACIRYTRISDLSSALYTNQDTRELHRLSESFSSNDSENRTTQHKTVPLKQNKTCWKLFSTRLPEIPHAHWKSKILTLYLHHPREARVISAVRNRHHYSRPHSTAFQTLISPFTNCFLETPISLYQPQRRLG